MSETEHANMGEENKVAIHLKNDINNYVYDKYNFEIDLSPRQKIIVIFLNIFTGGMGTILVPFLNKNSQRKTMIFAGILIGNISFFTFFFCFIRH
jgi:hypothetical protein